MQRMVTSLDQPLSFQRENNSAEHVENRGLKRKRKASEETRKEQKKLNPKHTYVDTL